MSWVTRMTVIRSLLHSASISPLSFERVMASRAPKGSSRRRISGIRQRARARATRCAMPPESWRGWAFLQDSSPTSSSARPISFAASLAFAGKASLRFASTVSQGSSLASWNMKPIRGRSPGSAPAKRTRPESGSSSPATSLRSVDFPQPLGPRIATDSPAPTRRSKDLTASILPPAEG